MNLPPPVLRLQDSARQQNFAEDFLPFLAGYYRQADFADLARYSDTELPPIRTASSLKSPVPRAKQWYAFRPPATPCSTHWWKLWPTTSPSCLIPY